jgi:hypothetical protein
MQSTRQVRERGPAARLLYELKQSPAGSGDLEVAGKYRPRAADQVGNALDGRGEGKRLFRPGAEELVPR